MSPQPLSGSGGRSLNKSWRKQDFFPIDRDSSIFFTPCVSVVLSNVDSPILFMPVLSITCALIGFGGGARLASRSAVAFDSITISRSKRA